MTKVRAHDLPDEELAPWDITTRRPPRRRKPRRVSLKAAMEQAKAVMSNVRVSGAVFKPDGSITLEFGVGSTISVTDSSLDISGIDPNEWN